MASEHTHARVIRLIYEYAAINVYLRLFSPPFKGDRVAAINADPPASLSAAIVGTFFLFYDSKSHGNSDDELKIQQCAGGR